MKLLPCVAQIINQRRRGIRWLGLSLAMCLMACLNACSLVVTGYNHLPQVLIFTWIDPHLDLDKAQHLQTKTDLVHLLDWHRQEQLPQYADWLVRMQSMALQNVDAEQVCSLFNEMRGSLTPLATQIELPLARLALSLQPGQLDTLKMRYAKDNKTWRKEWKLDDDKTSQLDAQTDKGQEHAERFYGRLNKAQLRLLRQLAQGSGFEGERTNAERLRQQADSLQTLQGIAHTQPGLTQARTMVHDWLQRSLQTPDESYAVYLKKRQSYNCQAAAQFHNNTGAEQRAHAVKVLKAYENDVRQLMHTSPS